MSSTLGLAKQQLRTMMKQRLASIPQDSVASQSRAILDTLVGFRPYVEAKRISVFLSMPSGEVQTDAIVRHALKSGKQVYVPYLHKAPPELEGAPARLMDMVRLADIPDYEALKPDKWGIPSIDPATVHQRQRILDGPQGQPFTEHNTLDLILMPGVAFDVDPRGGMVRRCGHGKGFYDYFLQRYESMVAALGATQAPHLLLYGLALTEQFLTSPEHGVPTGPLDQQLHGLILGNSDIKEASHLRR